MEKNSAVARLAAAMLAYSALWVLAPRATFMPFVAEVLDTAISLAGGPASAVLTVILTGVLFAPTIVFMAAQFAVVYYFAQLRMSFGWSAAVFLGCVLVGLGLMALIVTRSPAVQALGHTPTLRQVFAVVGSYQGYLKMPAVVMMMLAAAGLGYMVSLRVTDKNLLLPVVMLAAYIDLWTVTRGPVSKMMEKTPELVQAVSAPIPQAGAGAFVPQFLVGPGDFLFAGLVFAVVSRLGMNGPRTYWCVLAAMGLGMFGIALGIVNYFPALIMLAIGVIAANWREFRLAKQEVIYMLVVAVALAATLPLIWSVFGSHRKPKPKPPVRSTQPKSESAAPIDGAEVLVTCLHP